MCASIRATRADAQKSSQLLGAMIMRFTGRDQHMQVRHPMIGMSNNEQKGQEFVFFMSPYSEVALYENRANFSVARQKDFVG